MQANLEQLREVTKYIDSDKMRASLARAVSGLSIRVDPARLCNLFLSYCMRKPELLECTKQTLFDSLTFVAQCGLEPILGQVWLVPFRNNKTGTVECQVIIGYKGLVVLATRSGLVSHVESRVVYECDTRPPGEFSISFGDEVKFTHKPNWRERSPNSEMVGAYCIVVLQNGRRICEFMNRAEIEAIHDRSRAKDSGPWVTDPGEMWRKTVTRRTLKYTPMSIEDLNVREWDSDISEAAPVSASALPLNPTLPALSVPPVTVGDAVVPANQPDEEPPAGAPAGTEARPVGTEGFKNEMARRKRGRPKKNTEGPAAEPVDAPTQIFESAPEPPQPEPEPEPPQPEPEPEPPRAAATPAVEGVAELLTNYRDLKVDAMRERTLKMLAIAKAKVPDRIAGVLRENLITNGENELQTIGRLALRNVMEGLAEAIKEG